MSDLIELTETWAARITFCTNGETLGIDNDTAFCLTEREAVSAVVNAGQEMVVAWAADCSAGDSDSYFPHWNGGRHYNATYRAFGVAAELYHREPEPIGEDDMAYTDWSWASKKDTPKILVDGIEAIVARIGDAMSAEKERMEQKTAEEEAAFRTEEEATDAAP